MSSPANSSINRAKSAAEVQKSAAEQQAKFERAQSGGNVGGALGGGKVSFSRTGTPLVEGRTTLVNNAANRTALEQSGIKFETAGQTLFADTASLEAAISGRNPAVISATPKPTPTGYTKDASATNQVKDIFGGGSATEKEWSNLFRKERITGETETKAKLQRLQFSTSEKALSIYPSYEKPDYLTGGKSDTTYGGIVTPQSKGKSFGWSSPFVTTRGQEQVVRNTTAENVLMVKESEKAMAKEKGENVSFTTFNAQTPETQTIQFISTKEGSTSRGESNVFLEKAGTSSKPISGRAENVIQTIPSASFSTQQGTIMSQTDFRKMLATKTKKGAVFELFYGNQKVGETQGPRAYHDYLTSQKKYGENIMVVTTYPQVEKEIISSVKANPSEYRTKPESFWMNLGKSGFLSVQGMKQINVIFYKDWLASPQHQQAIQQDIAFRQFLTSGTKVSSGTRYEIIDQSGNIISTTSGPRAYHDYLITQKANPNKQLSVRPVYNWGFEEFAGKIATTPEVKSSGNVLDIGKGIVRSGETSLGGMAGTAYSALGFVSKGKLSEAGQDVKSFLTGGLRVGQLTKGRIEFQGNVPLTHKGETIIKESTYPTALGVQLGIEKPTKSFEYYAGSAFLGGFLAGSIVYGAKGLSPIKPLETGYRVGLKSGEIKPVYSGLTFGYNKPKVFFGFAAGKFKIGKPTEEEYQPTGSKQVIASPERGYEPSTPTKGELEIITNPKFLQRKFELNPSGRETAIPGLEAGLLQRAKTLTTILASNREIINRKYSNVLETGGREGISPQVVESGLAGISQKQGTFSVLNPITGKAGKIQGSTSLPQFLPQDLASQVKPHDIDVIKSNLGGFLEETQAKNLAKYTNVKIQKSQEEIPKYEIQQTTVKGRRIYAGKEKVIEFVTRKDETGSTASKSGTVFGIKIEGSTFKPFIEGTNKKVKTTSGVFQLQTNIAKQAFQNVESAKAQGATEQQLGIIGKGEYFGPELFAGKALKRPYLQTIAFVRASYKSGSKAQKAEASKALEAAHFTRYYQADNPATALYDWNEAELTKEAETSTLAQTPSKLATSSKAVSKSGLSSSIIFKPSSIITKPSSMSDLASTRSSVKSSKYGPLTYNVSSVVSKSGLAKSSLISSRSGKSGKSRGGSSGLGSVLSVSSIPSGSSGVLGKSGGPSGSSLIISGPSGGSSSITSGQPSIINPPKLLHPKLFINWKARRRYKAREGPTGLLNLGVKNIFASSLNIEVQKGKRIEF